MLDDYVDKWKAGPATGDRHILVLPEGAATPLALLGMIRAVEGLCVHAERDVLSPEHDVCFVVDSGTGALFWYRVLLWYRGCTTNY